jgi:hypothetical protein
LPKHVWRRTIRNDFGSTVSDSTETVEYDSEENLAGTALAGDTLEVDLPLPDTTKIKSFFVSSDKAVTLNLNDNISPDQFFDLAAGVALAWKETDLATNPITVGAITKLYFKNLGADDAKVRAGFILELAS